MNRNTSGTVEALFIIKFEIFFIYFCAIKHSYEKRLNREKRNAKVCSISSPDDHYNVNITTKKKWILQMTVDEWRMKMKWKRLRRTPHEIVMNECR